MKMNNLMVAMLAVSLGLVHIAWSDGVATAPQGGAGSLAQPQPVRVYILGRIAKPGVYQVTPETRVLDVLLLAGGLTINPNATSINITRKTPEGHQAILRIDATALIKLHDLTQNARLQNGDIISVSDLQASANTLPFILEPKKQALKPNDFGGKRPFQFNGMTIYLIPLHHSR